MSWLPETIYHHGSRGTAALRPLRGAVDGLWVSRGTGREVLIAWSQLGSGAYTLTADAGQPEPSVTSASTTAEVERLRELVKEAWHEGMYDHSPSATWERSRAFEGLRQYYARVMTGPTMGPHPPALAMQRRLQAWTTELDHIDPAPPIRLEAGDWRRVRPPRET